jgi:hypothetical protein
LGEPRGGFPSKVDWRGRRRKRRRRLWEMSDVVELGQGAAAAQGDENALVPAGGAGGMMGGGGYDGGYGMGGMGGRSVTRP